MDLKQIIKAITKQRPLLLNCEIGNRYYDNHNDIESTGVVTSVNKDNKDGVLRNADNRICHNYHQLLVDEKVAYMLTYPPIIDIDDNKDKNNSKVNKILAENFILELQDLCVEASNCGVAWLHYWVDINNQFKFKKVDTTQCVPLYDDTLEKNLIGFIRYYNSKEFDEIQLKEEVYTYIEYWTNKDFTKWKLKNINTSINLVDGDVVETQVIKHNLKAIPFIKFANNSKEKSDLSRYKKQIDLIDKVMSGYANDIEDIQQIIYILENYGGEDTAEFLNEIKRYKVLPLNTNEITGKGDLRTLQIDIPTEARKVLIEVLEKQIYQFGQGLQQDVESVGNASGVALKFFYRKLELKAGKCEVQFRQGIDKLVKAVLQYLNINNVEKVQQTYTRNMISNDLETAQIAIQSYNLIPLKYIYQNHPWIDDPEEALKLHEQEEQDRIDRFNSYEGLEHNHESEEE